MKIVITGGAGFIGSHLAKKWIEEKHEIHILDSLHNYYSPERKKQHLDEIKKVGSYSFYHLDLLDRDGTINLISKIKPSIVVHLAALPGVAYSLTNPLEYVDYDIKATINILEASGRAKVDKFIFASSSSVYGQLAKSGPVNEEKANGEVISPYAASKYSAESFCHVYKELYQMNVVILRFFTVYGPWGRPDMAIGSFIRKLSKGERIPIFGLENARDYTYINDIIAGIHLATHMDVGSQTFNLGNGNPITMNQLLLELKQHFPNLEMELKERRTGDVLSTWADISKAQKILGYNPKVSFSEGISKTVKWAERYAKSH